MGRRQRSYRVLALLALLAAGVSACASTPPAATPALTPDFHSLAGQVNEAVVNDPELASVFLAFEPSGTEHPDAEPFGRIVTRHQTWAKLTGLQRAHLLKKLAAGFTRLFLESPVQTADTATIDVVTDEGRRIGWFSVRPSRRDYTYQLSGSSGDFWQKLRTSL